MTRRDKLREKVLAGSADTGIGFSDLCQLLIHLGFKQRVRGDHHIFTADGMDEIINIQPHGANAKPYQVKQVCNLILKYRLGERNGDQV